MRYVVQWNGGIGPVYGPYRYYFKATTRALELGPDWSVRPMFSTRALARLRRSKQSSERDRDRP